MSWINYLLEANLYLTVFYALYYLILKNETYYQLNRVYLLLTSLLAFLIPFLQLGFLKPVYQAAEPMPVTFQRPVTITLISPVQQVNWAPADYLLIAYVSICCILAIHLIIKIYSLIRLSHQNKITINNSYKLIEIGNGANAFSFFNYLFISADQPQKQTVINHELIHIQQKHSWDILYLQLLKIVNWFNPVVYLLLHSIKEQHEFIADRETSAREENTSAYASFLLNNIYGLNQSGLTNTFFNKSLLKKRIIMLHQKPSGNLARLKYLAALPVCGALLCVSTLTFSKTYGWIDLGPKHKNDTTYTNETFQDIKPVTNKELTNKKDHKLQKKTTPDNSKFKRTAITITDKKGAILSYDSKKITTSNGKTLSETYSNGFRRENTSDTLTSVPAVQSKVAPMPPPRPKLPRTKSIAPIPPIPPARPVLALPPVPPMGKGVHSTAPKPLNTSIDTIKTMTKKDKIGYQQPAETKENPLIFVNGKKYYLQEKRKVGQAIICSASDSVVSYVPGKAALKKWGEEGKNGVILLYGKDTDVHVK